MDPPRDQRRRNERIGVNSDIPAVPEPHDELGPESDQENDDDLAEFEVIPQEARREVVDIEGLQQQIAVLQLQNENLAAVNSTLVDEKEAKEAENIRLLGELRAAQDELGTVHDELRAAQDELGTVHDELRAAQDELGTVHDELRAAQDEAATQRFRVDSLEGENGRLAQENQHLSGILENVRVEQLCVLFKENGQYTLSANQDENLDVVLHSIKNDYDGIRYVFHFLPTAMTVKKGAGMPKNGFTEQDKQRIYNSLCQNPYQLQKIEALYSAEGVPLREREEITVQELYRREGLDLP